jgi:hypothetical protein
MYFNAAGIFGSIIVAAKSRSTFTMKFEAQFSVPNGS